MVFLSLIINFRIRFELFFIYSRSFISNDANDAGGGLIGNPNTIGWHVVTPFALEGKNEMILVNDKD